MEYKSNKRRQENIGDTKESRHEKIKVPRKASADLLFLSDIEEVTSDFEVSENELT